MHECTEKTLESENSVCVSVYVYNMLIRKADIFNRLSAYYQRLAEEAATGEKNYLGADSDIVCFELTGMTPSELIRDVRKLKPNADERSTADAETHDNREPNA